MKEYILRRCEELREISRPRILALKCEDDSPAFDQQVRMVTIVREDTWGWYGENGTQWPKFAWKQVERPGAAGPGGAR